MNYEDYTPRKVYEQVHEEAVGTVENMINQGMLDEALREFHPDEIDEDVVEACLDDLYFDDDGFFWNEFDILTDYVYEKEEEVEQSEIDEKVRYYSHNRDNEFRNHSQNWETYEDEYFTSVLDFDILEAAYRGIVDAIKEAAKAYQL